MKRFPMIVAFVVVAMSGFSATAVAASDGRPTHDGADAAIRRGLGFLVRDALAWKDEHNCASCHHAALVIWSMHEARRFGHAVDEPVLADLTRWVAESGDGKTSVPRPAGIPKALNAKAVWFSLGLGADPKPNDITRNGLALLTATVKGDQTEDGSWLSWPETRPPIFGNSDESMTALATLALLPAAAGGNAQAVAARDKGVRWLDETRSDDDPQSVAMRLLLWTRLGRPANEWEPLAHQILERQCADGGWSQAPGMASDAWATGQVLYVLAHAGRDMNEPAIVRAREFLIKTQRDDGSWPMTSRATKPGGTGATSLIPITGAGSAWAVLGLVRTSPAGPPSLPTTPPG